MLITVFTATYNRANTITRLFESLKNQSFKNFEWLIVDDGSTDYTEAIVESFDPLGDFPIRYIKKENGGKHTAYNIGLNEARDSLFFNVDSDDWLDPNSLYTIITQSKKVMSDSKCGGIIALKNFADQTVIGNEFRKDNILMTFRELELSGQRGERSIIFKTSIAQKFKFPIINGERFMPEGVVYDEFTDFSFLIVNKALTICEYLPEGLSSEPKRLMVQNPGGYMLYYSRRIDLAANYKERIGYVLRYNFFSAIYSGDPVQYYNGKHKLLVTLMRPFNFLVAKHYKQI